MHTQCWVAWVTLYCRRFASFASKYLHTHSLRFAQCSLLRTATSKWFFLHTIFLLLSARRIFLMKYSCVFFSQSYTRRICTVINRAESSVLCCNRKKNTIKSANNSNNKKTLTATCTVVPFIVHIVCLFFFCVSKIITKMTTIKSITSSFDFEENVSTIENLKKHFSKLAVDFLEKVKEYETESKRLPTEMKLSFDYFKDNCYSSVTKSFPLPFAPAKLIKKNMKYLKKVI